MARRKTQASGQAPAPSKRQVAGAKKKKPALVKRVEQIAGALNSLNPFD